jgi:hypothetical protein
MKLLKSWQKPADSKQVCKHSRRNDNGWGKMRESFEEKEKKQQETQKEPCS